MLRKLKRTEAIFIEEKKIPKRNQLIRQAVILNETSKNSAKIQKEVDESLARISNEIFSHKSI